MSMFSAHQRIRRIMEEKKKAQAQRENPGKPPDDQLPDFEKMTAVELKEYAKSNGISISGLTKKEDIKTRIIEAVNAKNCGDGGSLLNDENEDGNGDAAVDGDKDDGGDAAANGKQENNDDTAAVEGAGENGANGGTA